VEQSLKETAGTIFYALASLFDDDAKHEAVLLLRDAVETGAVRDPAAADILLAIVRNSKVAA
jgi:hypothetical protein